VDESKGLANLRKHGVTFEKAALLMTILWASYTLEFPTGMAPPCQVLPRGNSSMSRYFVNLVKQTWPRPLDSAL
jgi:hypothetical protein